MSLIVVLLLMIFGFFVPVSSSSSGESGGGWAAYEQEMPACMVEPRTAAEIDAIRATPAVAIEPVTPETTTPIDEETRAAIEAVILMADACAEAGDFDRLAALYSPAAIQNGVLDAEPAVIQPGTPEATPSTGQPEPGKYGPPIVRSGWWIDDTHALVQVERGNTVREVRMVTIDGAWLIDSAEVVVEELVEDGMATPDMSVVLPVEVMQAIVDLVVGEDAGTDGTAAITIISAEPVDWRDTFLGCPVEGGFAAQVITPGYRVVVEYEGERIEVHTDLMGHAVACEGGQ